MYLLNYILGGQAFNSRLNMSLREKEDLLTVLNPAIIPTGIGPHLRSISELTITIFEKSIVVVNQNLTSSEK
jgi:hypothetical protein